MTVNTKSHPPAESPTQMAATLRDVSVVYPHPDGGDVVALHDVSMRIGPGEIICLVGPSGCGKSTALNLFAGFLQPSAGDVRVGGQPVSGPGPDRTVVFQSATLFPWLSVMRNITLAMKKRGEPKDVYTEKARGLIDAFGLSGFESAYPHQLSGGMKQRAQIARALMGDPVLLLMDEPFGALDSMTRLKMQEHLLAYREEITCSVLFITHDVDEAVLLGDRVYVMSARPGRVVAEYETRLDETTGLELIRSTEFQEIRYEILNILHSRDDGAV